MLLPWLELGLGSVIFMEEVALPLAALTLACTHPSALPLTLAHLSPHPSPSLPWRRHATPLALTLALTPTLPSWRRHALPLTLACTNPEPAAPTPAGLLTHGGPRLPHR